MHIGSVLIVEDDPDIRESMRVFLEDEGYAVFEAPDGVAGLAVLRASQQGLIVLVDYRMPRMDGIQMLREVVKHAQLAHTHVYLLVTANYDQLPAAGGEVLSALAIQSVRKPFDLDDLLAAVEQARQSLAGLPGGGAAPGSAPGRRWAHGIGRSCDAPDR